MANYDVMGNIVVMKFKRHVSELEKRRIALNFLKTHKSIRTVLEKSCKFSGRLRLQKTKFLAGENTKEVLYKENSCVFRFNVDKCYFSPRLASERKEIALKVKKGEKVLVMFSGVSPFSIVIGKLSKAKKIVSVELGKECNKYAKENVKRNKMRERVEIVQGDVRKKLPIMDEKFDRIIMARPNLEDSFLDVAFLRIKNGGYVHYYGFCLESEIENMKRMIKSDSNNVNKKIKILKVKKAGEISVRKFRFRIDIKVY